MKQCRHPVEVASDDGDVLKAALLYQREVTATHEAGHAIAAYLLTRAACPGYGWPFDNIRIVTTEEIATTGHMVGYEDELGHVQASFPNYQETLFDKDERVLRPGDLYFAAQQGETALALRRAFAEADAIISMAGPAAEAIKFIIDEGGEPDPDYWWSKAIDDISADLDKVHAVAEDFAASMAAGDKRRYRRAMNGFWCRLERRTRHIMEQPGTKAAISALADALLERSFIEEEVAAKIIVGAMHGYPRVRFAWLREAVKAHRKGGR